MTIAITGTADRNRTVGDLMMEVPRTGNRYLDLETGHYISINTESKEIITETKKTTKRKIETEV